MTKIPHHGHPKGALEHFIGPDDGAVVGGHGELFRGRPAARSLTMPEA